MQRICSGCLIFYLNDLFFVLYNLPAQNSITHRKTINRDIPNPFERNSIFPQHEAGPGHIEIQTRFIEPS